MMDAASSVKEQMMDCKQAKKLFTLYNDSELTLEKERELLEHVRGCSDCKSEFDMFMLVSSLSQKDIPDVDIPSDLHANIMAGVAKAANKKSIFNIFGLDLANIFGQSLSLRQAGVALGILAVLSAAAWFTPARNIAANLLAPGSSSKIVRPLKDRSIDKAPKPWSAVSNSSVMYSCPNTNITLGLNRHVDNGNFVYSLNLSNKDKRKTTVKNQQSTSLKIN